MPEVPEKKTAKVFVNKKCMKKVELETSIARYLEPPAANISILLWG